MKITAGLALIAALVAAPAAAQTTQDTARTTRDTAGVETGQVDTTRRDTSGMDTTRFDTAGPDTSGMEAPPDTARAVAPQVDSARAEATGYETGVVRPGAAGTDTAAAGTGNMETANVRFINREGDEIGTARVMQTSRGVLVEADLRGLPPGEHAFHVHQTGRCDAPTFESAGEHYAPNKNQHGFLAKQGPHAGDMPNIHALGVVKIEEYNPFVSLSGGDAPLLDADGSALVIHAKADDYRSQPSGNAGDRIACAVISRERGAQ